jgi:hypothetical protein
MSASAAPPPCAPTPSSSPVTGSPLASPPTARPSAERSADYSRTVSVACPYERAGTREQVLFDGLVSDFWGWATPHTDAGYQPTQVESYYDSSGNHRYTVVMTLTPGQSGWVATVGVEYGSFALTWQQYHDLGYRLAQVETHVKNGVRYYDGFFLSGSGGDDFLPGTCATEFNAALARDTTASLEIVDFDRVKLERTAATRRSRRSSRAPSTLWSRRCGWPRRRTTSTRPGAGSRSATPSR